MLYELNQVTDRESCVRVFKDLIRKKIAQADPEVLIQSKEDIDAFHAKIEACERTDSNFGQMSWELFPYLVKAYTSLGGFKTKRNEEFAKRGFIQGVVPRTLMENFLREFNHAKHISFRAEDHDLNSNSGDGINIYTEEMLNSGHRWFAFKKRQLDALKPIIHSLEQSITECVGMPWRVIHARSWETLPKAENQGPTGWHLDCEPLSFLKIMIYPYGVDETKGSIELELPEGNKIVVGGFGTWVFLKNSELMHRGRPPKVGGRLVIEINIGPAFVHDLNPIYLGQANRYPELPWQNPTPLTLSTFAKYFSERIKGAVKRKKFTAKKRIKSILSWPSNK